MTNLAEQYQGHLIFQSLKNKLEEIDKEMQNSSYNEVQIDSLFSYKQILTIIQANLNSKTLPMVPNTILNNLNASIQDLKLDYLLNINGYSQKYLQLMNNFSLLPKLEKKSEVKESFNSIIKTFLKKQKKIEENIDTEIKDFKARQNEQFENWEVQKNKMQEEIVSLREKNDYLKTQIETFSSEIKDQQTQIKSLINRFQTTYERNSDNYETRFINKENEYNAKIDALIHEQKSTADKILEHLEKRKEEIEKLWGIIGQAAISGNSQNYANKAKNMANILMVLTLFFMFIGMLYIGMATVALFKGDYQYIDFVWKVIISAVIMAPTFYTANLSKRQRTREFQLRDFEVKTACLEAFVESLNMSDNNQKNELKLELTKAFFKDQYGEVNNDECVIVPKEIAKIINTIAKNGKFNFNLGSDNKNCDN